MENEEYWAAKQDKDEIVSEIHSRATEYYNFLENSGLFWMWERSYLAYYGANLTNQSKGQMFEGSRLRQEEVVTRLKSNHFRSVIKHAALLTVSNKPAWACRATNSDYKSQAQTILGNGLMDYYMREKKLSKVLRLAVEKGLVFSEGWVHSPWDKEAGEIYEVDENLEPIYEGDQKYSTHSPLDVIRDTELDDDDHQWLIVRDFRNKWDLAATNEEVANNILTLENHSYEELESFAFNISESTTKVNRVPVFTMYHAKTPSVPEGRLIEVVGNIVLYDGPLPYKEIPLYCLKPDSLLEAQFGYSPAFEVLGPQQAVDVLSTAIMTNNAANAVQNFWTQTGDDLAARDLGGGMKHLQSETKPEAINLTKTAPETFNFRKELIGEIETLMGVSATVRGNPESSLKSGSALALVVSQSIQFSQLLDESYTELAEDLGTALINNLKDFAKTPRIAAIIGESNRPYQEEFEAKDLSQINRVTVERASALSKTISGRIELANNLLDKGMIETAKQYVTVLTTGQLDPAIEGPQSVMLNIRSENEDLRKGQAVMAVITENHMDHIREHKNLIENPEAKKDPQLVKLVTDHINEHLTLWRQMDMGLLMITGQQPPPPPPAPPGMPQQPQPGMAPPPPQPDPGPSAPPDQIISLPGAQDEQPNMPNLPQNPLSGQQFDTETGGM